MRKIGLLKQILSQIVLILAGLFTLVPLLNMFRISFDSSIKGAPTSFRLLPQTYSLDTFINVWKAASQTLSYPELLRNSLFVSLSAAVLSFAFGAGMAYAFARYRFRADRAGLFSVLLGAFLPPVALMTPLYILLEVLHIRASLFGLILIYTAFSLPFCIWNMRSSFQTITNEIEEAAFIDGGNSFTVFLRISLPLALPSIAVASLVAFLTAYSEFAIGWLFVEKSSNITLAMAIWGIQSMGNQPWTQLAALSILMSLPVIVIFIVLQKLLLERFSFGSLKD
ncbi:MAG: carbohydrate ABC transporter permease [Anaerolineaceae bacterium]|nr:carbohydrate ABC transporter permease [Anaerolineaceae bacterium]